MRRVLLPFCAAAVMLPALAGVGAWIAPTPERPLMRAAPVGLAATPPLLSIDTLLPTMPMLAPLGDLDECYERDGAVKRRCRIIDKEFVARKRVRAGFPRLQHAADTPDFNGRIAAALAGPAIPAPWSLPAADQVRFYNVTPPPQTQASPR